MSRQLTWQTGGTTIGRRDAGVTFVEILVAIVLLGTAVVGTLAGVRATLLSTTIERDHAKAQQWLQSAVGVIEAADYGQGCTGNTPTPAEELLLQAYYQSEIDTGTVAPFGFDGAITVQLPIEVWTVTNGYQPYTSQSDCYDTSLVRQQLLTIQVESTDGTTSESVEVVKLDRS